MRHINTLTKFGLGSVFVGAAAALIYPHVIRPWQRGWGATDEELSRTLLGDEFVATPRLSFTRAITIRAPIEQVWPWIAQIGEGRGGLYTYAFLETIFGGHSRKAERIVPEYQRIQAGDNLALYPDGPRYRVACVQPPSTLVLRTVNAATGQWARSVARDGVLGTYVFLLERHPDKMTRLIVRSRMDYTPTRLYMTLWGLLEPIDFLMGRKTLRTIKTRAEALGNKRVAGKVSQFGAKEFV